MDSLLDIPAVARALNLSPWTVRRKIAEGQLKALRIGRRVLIEPAEVERFVAAARQTTDDPESANLTAVTPTYRPL